MMQMRLFRRYASTIFALSSGCPPSAIAVIRISGERALNCLNVMSKRDRFEPRMLTYSKLYDGDTLLDRSMVVYMPGPRTIPYSITIHLLTPDAGPRTFTGEDSVELYLHGGKAVIESVTKALAKLPDVRMAMAGEFTRRAFFNGKMHLAQVEALGDLINAETSGQQQLALAQDEIPKLFKPIRQKLLNLIAQMEALIDFSDQVDEEENGDGVSSQLEELIEELRSMQRKSQRGALIRDGMKVAIVGKTNVGKSSLLNALAERDAAMVSTIEGTTRDTIEVRINLRGVPVILCDTAGLRQTDDPLESEGIRRTIARASDADLLIVVLDGSVFGDELELNNLLNEFSAQKPVIVVLNKSDLGIRRQFSIEPAVNISCKTREGMEELMNALEMKIVDMTGQQQEREGFALSRQRHRLLLDEAVSALMEAKKLNEIDSAIAVMKVREATNAIGQLAGQVVNEQILDQIFAQFCIGK